MLQGSTLQLFPSEHPQLYPLPSFSYLPYAHIFKFLSLALYLSRVPTTPGCLLNISICTSCWQFIFNMSWNLSKVFLLFCFPYFLVIPKLSAQFSSSLIPLHILFHTSCQVVGIPLNNVMQSFPFHYVHSYFSSS